MVYRQQDSMARYMLSYSPRYKNYVQQRASRYERRTMVLATTVVLWDALVRVATVVVTLALLLLVALISMNGLVALAFLLKGRMDSWW